MEHNKFQNPTMAERFVPLVSSDEIDTITSSLAHTINQRYQGEELVLIGVLKGSVLFLSDLAKKLSDVKVFVDFVSLDSIGRSKENKGTINIVKDIETDISGRNVLIVEEVIDTGRALEFLHGRLLLSAPRSIEVITLFDKPNRRAVPIKANYVGKQIEDQFIIGYGLDLEGYGRNLKDVHQLQYPN